MSLDAVHPDYSAYQADWLLMRDSYLGERQIKGEGTKYLPATAGQIADGQGKSSSSSALNRGDQDYNSYRTRALYLDFVTAAVNAMVGVIHREPAVIEVPSRMEALLESATVSNESLELLLRRIHLNQLREGRFGLLLEAPSGEGANALPYIATYRATAIRNWDAGQREQGRQETELVVLDEGAYERDASLQWVWRQKWRLLSRGTDLTMSDNEPRASGPYSVYTATENNAIPDPGGDWVEPMIAGRRLEMIPFVFVNAMDLSPSPDQPPLLGLANLCLAIYRGDADYRLNLHMQAQDTLVRIGASDTDEEEDTPVGAGAILDLPANADAKYIGVSATGLPEQRSALENLIAQAEQRSLQMMDGRSRQRESGVALTVRMTGATATLQQVARTGAEALQTILRQAALWIGADPDEVKVEANTDFTAEDFAAVSKAISDLVKAKMAGFPLSEESMHRIARQKDLTEFSYEDEKEKLDAEAMDFGGGAQRDLDPGAPDDAPDEQRQGESLQPVSVQ